MTGGCALEVSLTAKGNEASSGKGPCWLPHWTKPVGTLYEGKSTPPLVGYHRSKDISNYLFQLFEPLVVCPRLTISVSR